MNYFNRLIRIFRPIQLVLATLTFSLGAGISHYLGQTIDILTFIFGLLAVLAIQAAAAWLAEYFRLLLVPRGEGESERARELFRLSLIQGSYAALTIAGVILISLFATGRMNGPALSIFVVIILFMIAYALPPMRLAEIGYGELIQAFFLGTLLPSFAFLLEYGQVHRLLTFATFPLTLLALAYFLVVDFPSYGVDQRLGRNSLLTRLTWQRAIPIHHLLLLAAFLIFMVGPLIGIPWGLVWPVLVVLPFAGFQIFWLQRISVGGPTFWTFLTTLALATFGLTTYLLAFTFWTR